MFEFDFARRPWLYSIIKDSVGGGSQVPPSEEGVSDGLGDTTEGEDIPDGSEGAGDPTGGQEDEGEDKTFPLSYVQELRNESAGHRTKAKAATERAEALAQRLHAELVAKDGRLVSAAELPFDPDHLEGDALTAAIDDLLDAKPYLRKREVQGNIGQGQAGAVEKPFDLLGTIQGML